VSVFERIIHRRDAEVAETAQRKTEILTLPKLAETARGRARVSTPAKMPVNCSQGHLRDCNAVGLTMLANDG